MADVIRVTDEDMRADLEAHLGCINARAKRIPHVVGTEILPTEWDKRHQQINLLLDEWQGKPL